jgi:uncharacterized protein (TIGR03435 family)
MRGKILGAGWLVLTFSALGQAPDARFEVASVKPAATPGAKIFRMSGGPGTDDPGRLTYVNVLLKTLLLKAYGVKSYQISGPGWIESEEYEIRANVPPGATTDQLSGMLRNLLSERFNLTLHHETKDMAVYKLVVGKNGPKLKASNFSIRPQANEPGSPPFPFAMPDKDGFLQIPPGTSLMLCTTRDGMTRCTGRMQSLSQMITHLENELTRPIVDKTGLTGKFDFNLEYSTEGLRPRGRGADTPGGDGPGLMDAVQEQLGLKLESKKDPIDILVLDHIDKVPTDN